VDWVARLKAAHNAGRLPPELAKLRRIGLLVVDEVGYIRFEQHAACGRAKSSQRSASLQLEISIDMVEFEFELPVASAIPQ
jgi:hypothetical protein